MDRCVPPSAWMLQLLFSACVCLYTKASPLPSENPPSSGPTPEQPIPETNPSECRLRLEPPKLVVRFGDPVSVSCLYPQQTVMGWTGLPVETASVYGESLDWTQDSLSSWSAEVQCYALKDVGNCAVTLPITVYQPPERVSLTFRNHTGTPVEDPPGPLVEGGLYSLQCDVRAVAPAQNIAVAFYRGHMELGVRSSSTQLKTPVNESFSLDYRVSREDHGAHFWCEARLELGPEGPQPPPVVTSQNVTVYVHFREEQVEAPPTHSWSEPTGKATVSAQSQQGQRQPPEVTRSKGGGLAPVSNTLVILNLLLILATHCL